MTATTAVTSSRRVSVESRPPLSGKPAWVTGASRGLGRAIAEGLAAAGADVAVTARSSEDLQQVRLTVTDLERECLVLAGSVSSVADVLESVATIRARWGGLDVLVHCAGISPILKRAEQTTDEEWREVIDVNLNGAFTCAREAGRLMLESGGGSIVLISSVHGQVGMARLAPYAASKGALELLGRSLALEWADRGVRVNTVAPGYFETDMTRGLRGHERSRTRLLDQVPLGRFGSPEELTGAAVYLASDASSYVTGSTLTIDGGWTAA